MVGQYCAVSGCSNNLARCRRLGLKVTFHRFPSDPSLREIWIESCDRGEDWKSPHVFMCSDHFTTSDFRFSKSSDGKQKRTHLAKGTVPCRNLPASDYVCCAVGCSDAAPEILVRRFPTDVAERTELLGDVPRKLGIPLTDCYLCARHIVLKKFLKDEVEKIAKKKEAEDIIILEVTEVDGKHETKLIEPPTKRRRVSFQLEEPRVPEKDVELVGRNEKDFQQVERCGESSSASVEKEEPMMSPKTMKYSLSSAIGEEPIPVFVKNGESSELMFLHRLPHISASLLSDLDARLNANTPARRGNIASTERRSHSRKCNTPSTGDILVDRLHKRIQELEERLETQREKYKMKITELKEKYDARLMKVMTRLKETKRESPSSSTVHRNTMNKGPMHSPKQLPSVSEEVHKILKCSFTSNQIKKIINETEHVKWTDSELLDAFTLKQLSYGAYTFVRNNLKFPLPSPQHLRRWRSRVEKNRSIAEGERDSDTESESENDDGLDIMVAESVDAENVCGEVVLERSNDSSCSEDEGSVSGG